MGIKRHNLLSLGKLCGFNTQGISKHTTRGSDCGCKSLRQLDHCGLLLAACDWFFYGLHNNLKVGWICIDFSLTHSSGLDTPRTVAGCKVDQSSVQINLLLSCFRPQSLPPPFISAKDTSCGCVPASWLLWASVPPQIPLCGSLSPGWVAKQGHSAIFSLEPQL